MSATVNFSGWIYIIPDVMVQSWIQKGYISNNKILSFCVVSVKYSKHGTILYDLVYKDKKRMDSKWCLKDEIAGLKKKGYRLSSRRTLLLLNAYYQQMRDEVCAWYKSIFDYVEEWLFRNNFLHIEKGSIQSGFCVETNKECEVVKSWGAPLAKENNKVVQMKEKFGEVRVYFCSLTKDDIQKVQEFARSVEKKFDCICDFC